MSSRRLQDVFGRRLQDLSEDVKLLRLRRAEDVFKTCLQDQQTNRASHERFLLDPLLDIKRIPKTQIIKKIQII